jgi:hypothetical protein
MLPKLAVCFGAQSASEYCRRLSAMARYFGHCTCSTQLRVVPQLQLVDTVPSGCLTGLTHPPVGVWSAPGHTPDRILSGLLGATLVGSSCNRVGSAAPAGTVSSRCQCGDWYILLRCGMAGSGPASQPLRSRTVGRAVVGTTIAGTLDAVLVLSRCH